MAGSARQIAYRLKSEGKAEVVRDAQEVGQALKDSYDKGVQGADAATAAADRTERKYKAMAAAAQSAAAAQASQNRFNAILGVDVGPAKSARDSAAFYQEFADGEEKAARMARELKAQLDPLGAAQDRLNDELKIYDDLAKRGQISTRDLAQAQAQARARFDETSASIARQEKGITKLALAGRLNLARQAGDVFTTAAMGMNPAMIAIQQGPQILEAMRDAGIRLSPAMIAVGGSLGVVAAGTVLLASAWREGEASAISYERAVSGIGRTQGLTATQLQALTAAAAEQGEVSLKSAQEQATAYLATGRIGQEEISRLIAIGKDYASFMGVDAAEATKQLAKAMLDPEKAAKDLTNQTGLLTLEQLDNIDALVKQGDQMGAAKVLMDELSKAVEGHADKVGGIESAWDGASRAISDAITRLGEFLFMTDDERLGRLERLQAAASAPKPWWNPGINLPGGFNIGDRVAAGQAEQASRAADEEARKEQARANQKSLSDREARLAREREAEAAGRRAEAAARRREAEAARARREREREEREALQRSRREEDQTANRDMEIARILGQTSQVRGLEREAAVRQRIRQLIDDGTEATKAATQAEQEQSQIDDARAQAAEKNVALIRRSVDLEVARIDGRTREVEEGERSVELEERKKAYIEAGINTIREQIDAVQGITEEQKDQIANLGEIAVIERSIGAARADQLKIDQARARARQRDRDQAARDFQITLAQARGDRRALRGLEETDWTSNRALELERLNGWNPGEGKDQAAKDYAELMRAETTGAFRDGLGNLIDDIRSGGLKDALSEQLSRAGDRLIDKLLDGFLKIDFSGGKGSGAGNWLTKGMDFLFGKNADGTEYWKGGPTWVGERGPELLNIPRGAQIVEHQRSLRMVGEAERTREASPAPVIYSPSYTISGVDTQRLEQILARDRAEFAGRVVGVVADAQQRRVFG